MKHSINRLQTLTLLTAGVVLCLGAGSAQCQRGGRTVSRAANGQRSAAQASTGQGSSGQASGTGSASQTSGSQGSGCANSSSSGSSSSTSGTATTSGTSTSTSGSSGVTAQSSPSTGTVTAYRAASNQLVVQWSGNTSNVQAVYVGVLDANGNVISQKAITQTPVRATFALTSAAKYYAAQVVYANGTTHTTYTPIR